jgi:hypothetical protein
MGMNITPRVICYIPLHYGLEYLPQAIKAVEPFCEKIVILYTSKPSYGHGTNVPCPESEFELRMAALNASSKVQWESISAHQEGTHRGLIFRLAEQGGFDGVLTCDADEVWGDLTEWLPKFHTSKARNIGITGYRNFWRSFNHICRDGFAPIRYINLHNKDGQENFDATIYHFGCAQRMEIMQYKLLIHGHLPELRQGWLEKVYSSWYEGKETPGGLHLTAWNPPLWQAEKYDKTQLPQILREHFNYNKDVIL